jgi:hypothetical protein
MILDPKAIIAAAAAVVTIVLFAVAWLRWRFWFEEHDRMPKGTWALSIFLDTKGGRQWLVLALGRHSWRWWRYTSQWKLDRIKALHRRLSRKPDFHEGFMEGAPRAAPSRRKEKLPWARRGPGAWAPSYLVAADDADAADLRRRFPGINVVVDPEIAAMVAE